MKYPITNKKFIGRVPLLLKVMAGGEKLEGGLVAMDRLSTGIIASNNINGEGINDYYIFQKKSLFIFLLMNV